MGARQERDGFRMTRPRPTPRVSDERLVQIVDGWPDVEWGQLAADLRDSRAEAARWKAVADELAGAAHNAHRWFDPRDTFGNFTNSEQVRAGLLAALARYDAAKKESGASGMVPVADANAAIHKLQKELDRKERENR